MSAAHELAGAGLVAFIEALRPLIREEAERAVAAAGRSKEEERLAFTVEEVAAKLGKRPPAVRALIRRGELKATRGEGARAFLVTPAALQDFLEVATPLPPQAPVDLRAKARARLDRALERR